MFAVLKTGGKQYKVASGDVLRVEKLDAAAGDTIQFNEILMVGNTVGAPLVADAGVQAEVVDQIKGPKTINFVKRRRKHSSARKKGHRQQLTVVRIGDILEKGAEKSGVKAAVSGAGKVVCEGIIAGKGAPTSKAAEAAAKRASTPKAAKKADAAPAKAAPKKAAKAETAQVDAEAANAGTKPANLLKEARGGKADDLKRISGVGPALEKKLHANGIFHFDQVAAWNAEEIAYVDDQLSFKGRIERDEWLKQAAEFAKEA
ncbi:large subunit ribosomal protein L21 [Loktanella ponticola]|uniref:Large ribosomal subunit protein bL21 n=1 Tax=Yoonia ponticola TaxID=1524255 RepID=A0A7W9BNN6_9RHOB|nr:50S ribosomal protein L21 [Yoonia ponticola]MBB5723830.1 large subunit ribosomal protein L21 [Yoonia ponticola]